MALALLFHWDLRWCQILNITEGKTLTAIENKWLVGEKHCVESTTSDSPIRLDHHSFHALFLIVFVVSLLLFLLMLICKRYHPESQGDEGGQNRGDDPDDQANARDAQNRGEEVNDDADNSEHHIVEVDEEGSAGDGDGDGEGDEADDIVEVSEQGIVGGDDEADDIVEVSEQGIVGGGDEALAIVKVIELVQARKQQPQASLLRRRSNKHIPVEVE